MHVSDLEPDVRVGKGIGWTLENLLKTAKAFLVLAALLVDYAQSEENFIGLVKVQICISRINAGMIVAERIHIPLFIRRTEAKASSA